MPASNGNYPAMLHSAFAEAADFRPLNSLLVAVKGSLVAEQYFRRQDQASVANIRSVSKSILSALVGIALREGLLGGLDLPISTWLPEYVGAQTERVKQSITLRHLLTMSAGLRWIENAGHVRRWHESANWVRFVLDLPMQSTPGRHFNYNTTLTHLTSVILERVAGMSTLAFAQRTLFGPLGIDVDRWEVDPQGHNVGGSDIYMTSRDMLRIGQLVLQRGLWGDKSVIPYDWVDVSTRSQIQLRQPGFWNAAYTDYGFYWWLRKLRGFEAFVASGYGGQLIVVVPGFELVVVTTADAKVPYSSVMEQSNRIEAILEDHVIPAIQAARADDTSHN